VVAEGPHREVVELEVPIALLWHRAGVEQQQAVEVESQPVRGVRVAVVLDDVESQLGSDDARVAETAEVHLLVLQLRELLEETQEGSEVLLLSGIVAHLLTRTVGEASASGSFDVENVGLLVPVVRVVPEVASVAGEDELALGVEPAVEAGAAGARRDEDNQGVLGGVTLGRSVDIVEGLSGVDVEVAGVEGTHEEADGEHEGIDPVAVIDRDEGARQQGKEDYPLHRYL
jgi:hypothetical protein